MRKPTFLYIAGEGAELYLTDAAKPTRDEIHLVGHGSLMIVRIADRHHYHESHEWHPLPAGNSIPDDLSSIPWGVLIESDDWDHGPIHVHPSRVPKLV